ncbi:potassium transporter [Pseudohalioglobus sediminis]|uniref:Potassium transporter n=1 Tax=Pseudohalioglobus sediminis TaxID=2606449 RepID=A0A5B0WQM2_9GAMM|nr:monovalent cation:proton antiporter-2 (CPA2) family protein [Pseudohalioglobus sediminis]KAA1188887.1 potassium transporter [Pseudohalioglobus sediminis]
MSLIGSTVIFLGAAVLAVPLFTRLKLGAILGYLVAGALIGPSVFNLVSDPDTILHFAELGVVLLLFLIGIELEPEKLWRLRGAVVLTGGGQMLACAGLIGLALLWLLGDWPVALVIALALALSSTAFAIQLMNEHRMLNSPPGQQGFGILLMQDLAVIPILLLVESLAARGSPDAPAWYVGIGAIVLVLLVGRFLLNPFLRLVARSGSAEVMTASALLIVLLTALGMDAAGLSMGMGAFLAGVLLANSSFRHQLEMEIEPFKGLLLGLFFIAIGMNLDLGLLTREPVLILGAAVALVALKTAVIWTLLRASGQVSRDAMRVGLMLSQGGEFAFVVMAQAAANGLIEPALANQVTLIVGVSMALTAPLVILHSQFFSSQNCPRVYDDSREQAEPAVIIAGFGRFGQITGRILAANGIPFTALDNDAEHIEFVKKFGNRVFYGDATRLDLLKTAGIEHARVVLLALDDESQCLRVAELVRENYPQVRVVARAHNRMSVRLFNQLGVAGVVREMLAGSLLAADQVLREYGFDEAEAERMVELFRRHDEETLQNSLQMTDDMDALIEHSRYSREELASLFQQDREDLAGGG